MNFGSARQTVVNELSGTTTLPLVSSRVKPYVVVPTCRNSAYSTSMTKAAINYRFFNICIDSSMSSSFTWYLKLDNTSNDLVEVIGAYFDAFIVTK